MNPQENLNATGPATLAMSNISKFYSGVPALSGVSVEILPGEVHAILGENGAGKSTLMNVASGTVQPDEGTIGFEGTAVGVLSPAVAGQLGIAFVHQFPAVLSDLTVLENLQVALPAGTLDAGESVESTARSFLQSVGLEVHLHDRVELLSVAQKQLLEIAKAFAVRPKLLILDEPTAPLGQESVDLLFAKVRDAVLAGTSVVYITHRLAEVRDLADRVTVLRDGKVRGTADVGDISDSELLALIVGRTLDSTFPPKHAASDSDESNFILSGVSGPGFANISLTASRGEIVGVAGVVGNGQSELLRALAGLEPFSGRVEVSGSVLNGRKLLRHAAFMPADRHREGLMMTLSVRENAAISALARFKRWWLLSRKRELGLVGNTLRSLSVRAPSMDAAVSSLSGGNQQKVVMARALMSGPRLVIADEPTQGVDVGARAELYKILREVSDSGIPVVVASSDSKELEGLCDQVIVMSRGHAVETLRGSDINEERMIHAAVSATTRSVAIGADSVPGASRSRLRRFVQGDYAPAVLLIGVIVLLGSYIFSQNARYLSDFNIYSVLTLVTALGFIALGQTISLLIGGIDLSVGPLAGFLVVIASFFVNDGKSTTTIVLGLVLMLAVAAVVGLLNGTLIRLARFTPIAATLTVYIGLQGLSFILRNGPDGYINSGVTAIIGAQLGPVPIAFLVLVAATLLAEYLLRRRRWGWRLRATGSSEESARRTGVNINRTVVLAYVTTSIFAFAGAIMLMAQIGVGDPAQGVGYTLTSITAVVLGGTSLLGGRGTFIGTLLGSVLLVQVLNATTFLGLSQMWQYLFQGLLILVAAVLYSLARTRRNRSFAQ